MKDVARLAGVSIQTVSCVVNNKPGVTDETRERVRSVIEQIGYRLFPVAQSLRTRRTNTIALIVSDIANPSFAAIASTAEDEARVAGYSMVVYNTHGDLEREENYIRTAIERWVDGVLFVSTKDQMPSLAALQTANIPSVAIDRIPEDFEGPWVILDNIKAGRMAAGHLLSLGHTRLAHISGPIELRLARERFEGFRQALDMHGVKQFSCEHGEGTWECHSGYQAMRALLQCSPRPTGIFSANDRMALGAMRAIQEAGLRVPEDISIIGLDDIETSAYQIPPLTTVKQSFGKLATLGIHLLFDILAGKNPDPYQIMIEPELILRQSTAKAPPS